MDQNAFSDSPRVQKLTHIGFPLPDPNDFWVWLDNIPREVWNQLAINIHFEPYEMNGIEEKLSSGLRTMGGAVTTYAYDSKPRQDELLRLVGIPMRVVVEYRVEPGPVIAHAKIEFQVIK